MHKKIALMAALSAALFSLSAFALDTDLFRPQADNLGTFRLFGSKTLKPWQFSVGVFASYMQDPLIMKVGTDKTSIVDHQYTFHLASEVGFHDRISAGFDLPLMNSRHSVVPSVTDKNTNWYLGDIELHGKFRLVRLEDFPIGVTIVPFIEIPSGRPAYFTGDQGTDLGGKAEADWQVNRFYLAANLGVRAHLKEDTVTVTQGVNTAELKVGNEFVYGVGARLDLIPNELQLVADIAGATQLADFAKYEKSSPVEALGGLRYFIKERLIGLHLGAGAGLNDGYGAPKFRIFGGVTVQYPGTKFEDYAPDIVTIEKETRTIILKGVYFDTAKADIKPEAMPVLNENIEMLNKYPDIKVRIEGHTDDRNSVEYNQKLSERRAESVKKYFIDHGISADRLSAFGMGELRPMVPNDSAENMAKNRRIELHIIEVVTTVKPR